MQRLLSLRRGEWRGRGPDAALRRPSSRASAACQAGAQPGLSPQPEPAFVKRPRRMGRGLAPCEAPGGGGGCTPNLACSARIWPIRSARLLPTWRPTGSPPR